MNDKNKSKVEIEFGSGSVFEQLELPNAQERLRKARLMNLVSDAIKRMGLSQKDAADAMGLDQADISRLQHGRGARYSTDRLLSILAKLGIDVEITQRHNAGGDLIIEVRELSHDGQLVARGSRTAAYAGGSSGTQTKKAFSYERSTLEGTMIEAEFVFKPEDIADSEFQQIVRLVEGGSAVQRSGLRARMKNCHLVAFATSDGKVVSIAAIKNPSEDYVEGIRRKSGYRIPAGVRELGYVVTDVQYRRRGLAEKVCRLLITADHETLFATTADPTMERRLHALAFVRVGSPWNSQRHIGRRLSLWLKQAG